MYHFVFLAVMHDSFYCSTSSSALGIVNISDLGHCNRYIVISCCFNFLMQCKWSIFLYGNIPLYLGELLLRHIFKSGRFFLIVEFKSSLYILHNNPLSNVSFANIFSHCVAGFLILSIFSFTEHTFLILMKSRFFFHELYL